MSDAFQHGWGVGKNLMDECSACGKQGDRNYTSREGDWKMCWNCNDVFCTECAPKNISNCAEESELGYGCEDTFCNHCLSITTYPKSKQCQGCINSNTSGEFRGDFRAFNKAWKFDRAWELVKAPIVPHSLIQDEQDEYMYSALFKDPVTEEIIPMKIGLGTGRSYAEITDPDESLPRSEVSFQNWGDDGENNVYESRGTTTNLRHQRKGYATALYNILAHLLKDKKYNGGIYPSSDDLYEDGEKFWTNAYETGKTNPDGSWRSDLYDRI